MARRSDATTLGAIGNSKQKLLVEQSVRRHTATTIEARLAQEVGEAPTCFLDDDLHGGDVRLLRSRRRS